MYRYLCVSLLAIAAGLFAGTPAMVAAEPISVRVDAATLVKLPEKVGTIVIGNPLIADATVQAGGLLVVTGKGYGATNLLALDHQGNVLLDKQVLVSGPRDRVLVVYRGTERETYSCEPYCERRITLGDGPEFFNINLSQTQARATQAGSSSPGHTGTQQ